MLKPSPYASISLKTGIWWCKGMYISMHAFTTVNMSYAGHHVISISSLFRDAAVCSGDGPALPQMATCTEKGKTLGEVVNGHGAEHGVMREFVGRDGRWQKGDGRNISQTQQLALRSYPCFLSPSIYIILLRIVPAKWLV